MRIFEVTNGKIIKKVIYAPVRNVGGLQLRFQWYEQCTDWYQIATENGEIVSITYLDTTCESWWVEDEEEGEGDDDGNGDCPWCNSDDPDDGDTGGGDSDPCNGPNPPADCIKCNCTNQAKTISGIGIVSFAEVIVSLGSVSHSVVFTVSDCSGPTYSVSVIPSINNPWGAWIAPLGQPQLIKFQEYPVKSNDLKCGHMVNYEIAGLYELKLHKRIHYNGQDMQIDTDQTGSYDDLTRLVHLD